MLDFLFITSPSNARNPHPPYYYLSLCAYLRQKGLSVKIIDTKGGDRPQDLAKHQSAIRELVKTNPSRFVGLAAFHSDYPMVMSLGKIVKEEQPNTTLLVGNAHSTINPEDFIYGGSPFDIAILGEGEETCYELWKEWPKNFGAVTTANNVRGWPEYFEMKNIKGIAFLGGQSHNEFIKTEPRPFMDLRDLPMPAYDLVDMDYYLNPQKLIIRRIYTSMIAVFAGRGCPYAGNACDFCAANVVWKANIGKTARLRPVDNVIEEINHLVDKYDVDFIYLFDDMFGMSKQWMEEWFEKKRTEIDNPFYTLPYACQTRVNLVTEEMVKGLKASGCIQIDLGIESGSQKLLDRVNKKITLDQIRNAVSLCHKYKIRSFATMLLNLPGETEKDLKDTWNFLKEIKLSAGAIWSICTAYPGTKMYENLFEPKLQKEEYHLLKNNRLDPLNRFRLAEHNLDLEQLWVQFNKKFLATPFFERMWCLKPFQSLYWKAIWNSKRFWTYIWCWSKDIPKTAFIWISHTLRIYRWLKKIQYHE